MSDLTRYRIERRRWTDDLELRVEQGCAADAWYGVAVPDTRLQDIADAWNKDGSGSMFAEVSVRENNPELAVLLDALEGTDK